MRKNVGLGAVIVWVGGTILTWNFAWPPLTSGNLLLSAVAASSGIDPVPWTFTCMVGVLVGAMNGGFMWLIQWLILRKRFSEARSLFLPTMVGMGIGLGIGLLVGRYWIYQFRSTHGLHLGDQLTDALVVEMAVQSATLTYLPVGVGLGVFQGLALQTFTRRSGWWVLVSSVAWPLAAALHWLTYGVSGGPFCQSWSCLFEPPGPGYYPAAILGWLSGGLLVGVSTGITMRYLLDGSVETNN